jgi:hypothetical protein
VYLAAFLQWTEFTATHGPSLNESIDLMQKTMPKGSASNSACANNILHTGLDLFSMEVSVVGKMKQRCVPEHALGHNYSMSNILAPSFTHIFCGSKTALGKVSVPGPCRYKRIEDLDVSALHTARRESNIGSR